MAREHLRAGRSREALKLLEPLTRANPEDTEVDSLAARAEVFSAPKDALARIERLPRNHPWEENAMIVREFGRLFINVDSLPASPLRDAYVDAARALQQEEFEEGARRLIDVLLEKPSFDENHGKAVVLALFKHLGMRHPVSEKFSRSYSMAVNV